MNKHELFNTITNTNLDVYSQLSCLGSMVYVATSEAIRQAMKIIPDHPTPETMEAFFNEERNLKVDVEYADNKLGDGTLRGQLQALMDAEADVGTTPGNYREERRTIAALLDLRQDMLDMSEELSASLGGEAQEERTIGNTLMFMLTGNQPSAAYYASQYTAMMRAGAKNYGQTRAEYVKQQLERAAKERESYIAKGEHAVQFLEGLDPLEGPIDERVIASLAKRCVAKLIDRRVKVGQSLSWRATPEARAEAEADIICIEAAIVALGGEVPQEAVTPPEVDADGVTEAPVVVQAAPTIDAAAILAQLVAMLQPQSNVATKPLAPAYRVPGPVTVVPATQH